MAVPCLFLSLFLMQGRTYVSPRLLLRVVRSPRGTRLRHSSRPTRGPHYAAKRGHTRVAPRKKRYAAGLSSGSSLSISGAPSGEPSCVRAA